MATIASVGSPSGDGVAAPHPHRRGRFHRVHRFRRFSGALAGITAAALVIRLVYLLGWHHPFSLGGDAYYYSRGANLLVDGHGFPQPYRWFDDGVSTPAAQHPPAYLVALAATSLVGLRSPFAHQLLSCLLGAGTVVVLGLAGRRLAGPAVGLVAAGFVAVYPNFWFNDALLMSETLVQLTVATVVLASLRFWQLRTPGTAVWLGVAVALAALTHAEMILLGPLIALPLCLLARSVTWRRRVGLLVSAAAACVLVLAPWCVYNIVRFEKPVLLTTGLDAALVVSNCPDTYSGEHKGWWSYPCFISIPPPPGDESVQGPVYQAVATDFIRAHRAELPGVVAARVGRLWGVYRPQQQLVLDTIEQREIPASRAALAMFYGLVALSVPGIVLLRRRREPLSPVLAPLVTVTVSAALIYGTTRFRAGAEDSLVLLAAVGSVGLVELARRRRDSPERLRERAGPRR
ncbi:MAG: hypothetical protein QOJ32_2794 [Frankiaceae bacterium]|nr:hypothetical protein [Frankiaceae bacterium]